MARVKGWTIAGALLLLLATSLGAAGLSRNTLWQVERTCVVDSQTTGSPFPCLEVDLTGGIGQGVAVLRAPFSPTHIVVMPTARITGIEDPKLQAPNGPDYLGRAWEARHFVQEQVKRPLGWDAIGLAVNSRLTRSQDQLHVHVDCVKQAVRRALAERLSRFSEDAWTASGVTFAGQSYWVRRVGLPNFAGVDPFHLATEIPAIREDVGLATLAVIGIGDQAAGNGFLLLVGRSNPSRGGSQSTTEDLLDHSCGTDPSAGLHEHRHGSKLHAAWSFIRRHFR